MKIALFPGSFDPFTKGHYSVVEQALKFVDKIIIAVGVNENKHSLFTIDEKIKIILQAFPNDNRIEVCSYDGLTADFAIEKGCSVIIRGVRSSQDFEFEKSIADANREISGIDTLLLFTKPEDSFISSTFVRELLKHEKDVSKYLSPGMDLYDLYKIKRKI